MADEDDFLSRWSRRKRREEAEPAPETPAAPPEPEAEPATEAEEAALLDRLGLPAPETLQPGDDFARFMGDGVPDFLRRRALRVLWRSNPVLANLDGLNDYDDDFTSAELNQKVLATAYKIGRGFLPQAKNAEILQPDDKECNSGDNREAESPTELIENSEATETPPETVAPQQEKIGEQQEKSLYPKRMRFES